MTEGKVRSNDVERLLLEKLCTEKIGVAAKGSVSVIVLYCRLDLLPLAYIRPVAGGVLRM